MRTIKELIELAQAGEAAEFTNSIQEALEEVAVNAIEDMAAGPEEDDKSEFDMEDDIEDLPLEDDIDDLDEEELAERNALNHQKARAFRAGKKEVQAKGMSTPYVSAMDRKYGNGKETIQKAKDAKELALAKSRSMHADATEKAVKLGAKSREMSHIRDAGKKYKETHQYRDKTDASTAADNARSKEHFGQGKFLHRHLSNQHDKLRHAIDDMRNDISNAVYKHASVTDHKDKYGDTWGLSRKEGEGPSLTTKHIENLKHLHTKLQALHHAANSLAEDIVDWDLVEEDFLDIEDEYLEILNELEEGKTFKANDDDMHRSHKRQSYLRRRERRMKMEETEDEEELLSLRDDLTDEELQEIVDTITEEHFEMLDELSKNLLARYIDKASTNAADHAYDAGMADPKSPFNGMTSGQHFNKSASRLRGVSKAARKLAK